MDYRFWLENEWFLSASSGQGYNLSLRKRPLEARVNLRKRSASWPEPQKPVEIPRGPRAIAFSIVSANMGSWKASLSPSPSPARGTGTGTARTPVPQSVIAEAVKAMEEGTCKGPFQPTWESIGMHSNVRWFDDAKFGIYCHWGGSRCRPLQREDFGDEWYSYHMYIKGTGVNAYHGQHYGALNKFGFKDFIPMFKAEKFDPDSWRICSGRPAPGLPVPLPCSLTASPCGTAA